MTEREKMTSGKIYDPTDPELCELREKASRLCHEYNATCDSESDSARRAEILSELCGKCGDDVWIRGPVWFDSRLGRPQWRRQNDVDDGRRRLNSRKRR